MGGKIIKQDLLEKRMDELTNENKINTVLIEKINKLINSLSSDFSKNYNKKENNWILGDFDEKIISNMVFVSSFESKSGNMMEDIATEIAKVTFGKDNVPLVVAGRNITTEEFEKFKADYIKKGKKAQVIISKSNLKDCKKIASNFREDQKGSTGQSSTLNQTSLQDILNEIPNKIEEINVKPVDLIYKKEEEINLLEIKAGGDLDSSNAPGNIDKMFTWVSMLGSKCNLYFATLYHKDGEGNLWKGGVKKYIGNDMILVGKEFWEKILPKDISFEKFKEMYFQACKNAELNKNMTELIDSVIQKE